MKKYFKKMKKYFWEVMRTKDSPKSIAAGFAIGTAIAILPTFGLGAFIGLLVIFLFKKVSKVSLFSAFIVWNPAILIVLAGLSYKIGSIILKDMPLTYFKLGILNTFYLYSGRFIVGNIILVLFFSTLSYFVVYFLSKKYQKEYRLYFADPIDESLAELKEIF